MADRETLRNQLSTKIVGLEDSGYGDFEYSTTELNTYLDLAVLRLFPALYRKAALTDQTVTTYGTRGFGYVSLQSAAVPEDRVFMVEDASESELVYEWNVRPYSIVDISDQFTSVNIYYYEAYVLPVGENTDSEIPQEFNPLIVLGALLEALESRQDTGVRPDPERGFPQVNLIDRLSARYQAALLDVGMSLPAVVK
jgi:hypothetical protein